MAPSFTLSALTPSALAASSFSRTAMSCAPKRECSSARVTTRTRAATASAIQKKAARLWNWKVTGRTSRGELGLGIGDADALRHMGGEIRERLAIDETHAH